GDLLRAWCAHLGTLAGFGTPRDVRGTLRRGLGNLLRRGLIERERNAYALTAAGRTWLAGFDVVPRAAALPAAVAADAAMPTDAPDSVATAAKAHNAAELARFQARLMRLEPAEFEHFVKALLDAMDYEEVRVTRLSNDKGVDLVARVRFGITEITEVVQVK